jgi:threonine dehydrogenase-like Zn-dependent dehydrogenase
MRSIEFLEEFHEKKQLTNRIPEPFKVTVEERPYPKLEHPDDALIKVTTAAICGSDLHMYQGRTAAQGGLCFGT